MEDELSERLLPNCRGEISRQILGDEIGWKPPIGRAIQLVAKNVRANSIVVIHVDSFFQSIRTLPQMIEELMYSIALPSSAAHLTY